ncbi:MAG: tRNA preQ1(34) S-adenosylmethionine ribosyltransferase-isomerase QueA [Candidatus Melainabacteria bacterium]|nr:MAG: tRNA preQ1(34) S-adenosylmethionine ribosyltransferase-isomerase QueA [Candidatus Melainabacteria bacterium]
MKAEKLDLRDFQYDLPQNLIAQEPCRQRDASKLLWLNRTSKVITHHVFHDLVDLLQPSDVLVVNDTKVVPARLVATRNSGGKIKLLLIKPEADKPGVWQAMVTPIKRLKTDESLTLQVAGKTRSIRVAGFVLAEDGHKRLLVDLGGQQAVFELLNEIGYAPLPPYITRQIDEGSDSKRQEDLDRYQTVYANTAGAVAAPTAGLHFSQELLAKLRAKGVTICSITLHVGPGTFKPIADSIEDHVIEPEQYSIPITTAETINKAKSEGQRIIAVGTTTCRALESATAEGVLMSVPTASTSLYIRPGYQFKLISGLITNFHLSGSSLLLLVAAFVGRDALMDAYHRAIESKYRFFSYGDAMIIL